MGDHKPQYNHVQKLENLLKEVQTDQLLNLSHKTEEDLLRQFPSVPHQVLVRASNKKSRLISRTQLLRLTPQEIKSLDTEKAKNMTDAVKETKDMFQFTATATNTWDESTFQKWKHACETVVLDGVSNALAGQEDSKLLKLIFGIQPTSDKGLQLDPTGRKNVKGLQICHEVMLTSPWEEPGNIDRLIRDLVEHKRPDMVKDAESGTNVGLIPSDPTYDHCMLSADYQKKIKGKLVAYESKVKKLLQGLYKVNSHTFHVFLWDLFPQARTKKSIEFTQVVEAYRQHQSQYIANVAGFKEHTAKDTLKFLRQTFVKSSGDSLHILWTSILLHTRKDGVTIYDWCRSYTPMINAWVETANANLKAGKKPKKFKKSKIKEVNRLIATQLTDNEQAIITSVHPLYTCTVLVEGDYDRELLLVKISEANAKFHRAYKPTPTIRTYINNRNDKHKKGLSTLFETLQVDKSQGKGTGTKTPRNRQPKRQHYLIEDGIDNEEVDAGSDIHFEDENEEEAREAFPVYKKPYEKRNCVNPYCVKKNIGHTHNTKDCNHKDKNPDELQDYQIRPPRTPYSPFPKVGSNTGSSLGNRSNTGNKSSYAKPRSSFYSEKGKKGKGKGKGKSPHAKGNRHRLVCTFCKKDGHEKSDCRAFARAQTSPARNRLRGVSNRKALLFYDRFEDSVNTHDCLYCEDPDCSQDYSCLPPEHVGDDTNSYDVCYESFIAEAADEIATIKMEEDSNLAEERSHYLQQQEGAGSSLGSSSEEPKSSRYDSDGGETFE